MKVIHKAELSLHAPIRLPLYSDILCVKEQYNKPVVYYHVDPNYLEALSGPKVVPVSTGYKVPLGGRYLGTVLLNDGTFVLHYYEADACDHSQMLLSKPMRCAKCGKVMA